MSKASKKEFKDKRIANKKETILDYKQLKKEFIAKNKLIIRQDRLTVK